MATTTWKGGSGDWDTASNWTDGVPTAADTAVFDQTSGPGAPYTVGGGGDAAALTVINDASQSDTVTLAGTHAVGTFTAGYAEPDLAGTAALSFQTGSIYAAGLRLDTGATLGTGALALFDASLDGALGLLANPLAITGVVRLSQTTGTLAGAISGAGGLSIGDPNSGFPVGGDIVLSHAGNTYAGGTELMGGSLEIAAAGAVGTGPVTVQNGFLLLDAGVSLGAITAATQIYADISAVDGTNTIFGGVGVLNVFNGRGHSEVIGRFGEGGGPNVAFYEEAQDFEHLNVTGGTGSVTVFAADAVTSAFGGTAGGNLIVAGTNLPDTAFRSTFMPIGFSAPAFYGSTIGGGGDGDLLVATGNVDDVVAAGAGRETLTGSGALGDNSFFGGAGADLIVGGGGHDVVVGGSGADTFVGGAGGTAIFAGGGADLVVGGAGADYIQAGTGSATVYVGEGADLLAVVAGQAGGSVVVSGFRVGTDHVAARGYGTAPAQATEGGNTVLSFADHTRVTLLGVASLGGASLV